MFETCRFCEKEDSTVSCAVENLFEDLLTLAGIRVKLHPYLPTKACRQCVQRLKDALAFRELCRKSEERLLNNYVLDELPTQVVSHKIKEEIVDYSYVDSAIRVKDEVSVPVVVSYEEVFPDLSYTTKTEAVSCTDDEEFREVEVEVDMGYENLEILEEVQVQEITATEVSEISYQSTEMPKKQRRRGQGAPRARLHDKIILPPTGPYACEPCNKVYEKRSSYLSHYRDVHDNNPRKFVCDICGVSYTRDISLQGHLNVHMNRKPFKCGVCGMGFARKYGLGNHMRSHTKEKKFFCKYCGKGFSFLTDVKRHETVHTGIHLYSCPVCNKGFNRKKALHEHQTEHEVK